MYGVHIQLRRSLKLFLEIPGMFNQILEYMQKLSKETNIITNIIQAELWTAKYSVQVLNDLVLPFYIFFDNLEVGNPLGSHSGKNKFCAVYGLLPAICYSNKQITFGRSNTRIL